MVDRRISTQIGLRQPEQRRRGSGPVLLQMNESARQLNQALVKPVVSAPALLQPYRLQHLVRFEIKLPVETVEIAQIMRVQILPLMGCNQRRDLFVLMRHVSKATR